LRPSTMLCLSWLRTPPPSTLFPYTTLFRSTLAQHRQDLFPQQGCKPKCLRCVQFEPARLFDFRLNPWGLGELADEYLSFYPMSRLVGRGCLEMSEPLQVGIVELQRELFMQFAPDGHERGFVCFGLAARQHEVVSAAFAYQQDAALLVVQAGGGDSQDGLGHFVPHEGNQRLVPGVSLQAVMQRLRQVWRLYEPQPGIKTGQPWMAEQPYR